MSEEVGFKTLKRPDLSEPSPCEKCVADASIALLYKDWMRRRDTRRGRYNALYYRAQPTAFFRKGWASDFLLHRQIYRRSAFSGFHIRSHWTFNADCRKMKQGGQLFNV